MQNIQLKRSVKWSSEIEQVAFFHPSEPVASLQIFNTLSIIDTNTSQGSISASHPLWRISENLKFESKVQLKSINVVFQSLFMMVSVPNYAYEKQVTLLYSLDDWRNVLSADGKYFASSDSETDLFQISIPLNNLLPLCHSLKFCIKYKFGSHSTIYENNNGQNHTVSLYTAPRLLTPSAKRKQKIQRKRLVSLTMATGLGPVSKHWPSSHIPPPKNMLNSYEMHCFSYTY